MSLASEAWLPCILIKSKLPFLFWMFLPLILPRSQVHVLSGKRTATLYYFNRIIYNPYTELAQLVGFNQILLFYIQCIQWIHPPCPQMNIWAGPVIFLLKHSLQSPRRMKMCSLEIKELQPVYNTKPPALCQLGPAAYLSPAGVGRQLTSFLFLHPMPYY